ncbi:MAG TPA: GNAT family N-acetyltransferase [Chthoniobacterales bacterium]
MTQPTLRTDRLILRPFISGDAAAVQELAGEFAIADTTLNVPHPYADGLAESWIAAHEAQYRAGEAATFAITLKADLALIGAIGLTLFPRFRRGELGYWIGVPFWNRGFCTEAVRAVIDFGFTTLKLHKICAHHLSRNPASGRVMQKAGMSKEGTFKDQTIKWDRFESVDAYGRIVTDTLSLAAVEP